MNVSLLCYRAESRHCTRTQHIIRRTGDSRKRLVVLVIISITLPLQPPLFSRYFLNAGGPVNSKLQAQWGRVVVSDRSPYVKFQWDQFFFVDLVGTRISTQCIRFDCRVACS